MTEPERWLTDPDAPEGMSELLSAAQKVGPTAVERAALAGKLGVATSGLWMATALKALAVGAVVAGGAWTFSSTSGPQDTSAEVATPVQNDAARALKVAAPVKSTAPTPPSAVPTPASEHEEPAVAAASVDVPPQATPIPSEAWLLQKARASLTSAPRAALSRLAQHEQLYPHGVLAEEREVMKVRALNNLGQDKAAQAEAEKFRKEHPKSVHHLP